MAKGNLFISTFEQFLIPALVFPHLWGHLYPFLICFPSSHPFERWKVLVASVVSDSLWPPMDCRLPGSSVHEILQARILEWVAIPFSRGSSWPRDRAYISCIPGGFFTIWATREALQIFHVDVSSSAMPFKIHSSAFFSSPIFNKSFLNEQKKACDNFWISHSQNRAFPNACPAYVLCAGHGLFLLSSRNPPNCSWTFLIS